MLKIFPVIVVSVLLSAFAQIFLRKGMLVAGATPTATSELLRFVAALCLNGWLIAGVVSYVLSFVIWLYVLAKVEVSLAYPFQSLSYILIAVISFYTLGESLNLYKISGILIICIGVIVLTLSPSGT